MKTKIQSNSKPKEVRGSISEKLGRFSFLITNSLTSSALTVVTTSPLDSAVEMALEEEEEEAEEAEEGLEASVGDSSSLSTFTITLRLSYTNVISPFM